MTSFETFLLTLIVIGLGFGYFIFRKPQRKKIFVGSPFIGGRYFPRLERKKK
jgi:hypothetical protein